MRRVPVTSRSASADGKLPACTMTAVSTPPASYIRTARHRLGGSRKTSGSWSAEEIARGQMDDLVPRSRLDKQAVQGQRINHPSSTSSPARARLRPADLMRPLQHFNQANPERARGGAVGLRRILRAPDTKLAQSTYRSNSRAECHAPDRSAAPGRRRTAPQGPRLSPMNLAACSRRTGTNSHSSEALCGTCSWPGGRKTWT